LLARRKIGVQLQISQMPDTLRVREYIKLFSSYYANPRPFAEVVESAGLMGLEGRLFKQLSGGEQQRLRFALAVCGDPEFVILDEPTVGMDVEARRSVWEQIRRLASEEKTVLLTTHHLEEADALADRIVIINAGKVIADGTPKELKRSVAGKRIRCTSMLPLDLVLAMRHVTQARKEGDEFEIQTDNADSIIRQLIDGDAQVANIEIAGTALEDSFLALTRQSDSGEGRP
jgi:ABC-2 type transport system ATP-binding protein